MTISTNVRIKTDTKRFPCLRFGAKRVLVSLLLFQAGNDNPNSNSLTGQIAFLLLEANSLTELHWNTLIHNELNPIRNIPKNLIVALHARGNNFTCHR